MNTNPLELMPKVGSAMRVPGGLLVCERWEAKCSREPETRFELVLVFWPDHPPNSVGVVIDERAQRLLDGQQ